MFAFLDVVDTSRHRLQVWFHEEAGPDGFCAEGRFVWRRRRGFGAAVGMWAVDDCRRQQVMVLANNECKGWRVNLGGYHRGQVALSWLQFTAVVTSSRNGRSLAYFAMDLSFAASNAPAR